MEQPAIKAITPARPPTAAAAQASWKDQRVQQLMNETKSLSPEHLKHFADKALADLAARGMASPVIRRRHAAGDFLFAMLGQFVVRAYAEETYGPNWDEEPSR